MTQGVVLDASALLACTGAPGALLGRLIRTSEWPFPVMRSQGWTARTPHVRTEPSIQLGEKPERLDSGPRRLPIM